MVNAVGGIESWPPRSRLAATLNCYSRTGTFDETAATVAAVLAAQATIAVSRSPAFAAARDVVEQAKRDADDRADVHLATGMLMANQGCTADQAAGVLHQAADQDNQTVVEIAQRIIDEQRRT